MILTAEISLIKKVTLEVDPDERGGKAVGLSGEDNAKSWNHKGSAN